MQALQITNQRNTYANYKFDNKKVQIMKVGIENWRKRNYKTEAMYKSSDPAPTPN